jgi:hypothetical protein
MSDDIETLRAEIERLSNRLEWEKRCHRVASEKLVSVETERDSLRKALDDRFAADLKAAKAIFAETGRTSGFPSVREVVAFYVAEVERLEKVAENDSACIAALTHGLNERNAERDSLRAILSKLSADAPAQQSATGGGKPRDMEPGNYWEPIVGRGGGGSGPAQQISDEVRKAMVEAIAALEPIEENAKNWLGSAPSDLYQTTRMQIATLAKLRSVMK